MSNQDSVIGMKQFHDNAFDFCFTSPPYFDAEKYEENSSQSSQAYYKYGDWFENWLLPAINEAQRISKKTAINIANTGAYHIADDLRRYFEQNDIQWQEDQIRYPSRFGGKFRFEPIFIIE